jgi:hypothetical protein
MLVQVLLLRVSLLCIYEIVTLVRFSLHALQSIHGAHLDHFRGCSTLQGCMLHVGVGQAEELGFLLDEEELLGAED